MWSRALGRSFVVPSYDARIGGLELSALTVRQRPMTERTKRDRPARNPGGVECQKCGAIFIGEEWHQFCGVCIEEVADELAKAQHSFST